MKKEAILFLLCTAIYAALLAQPNDSVILTGKIEGYSVHQGESFVRAAVNDVVLDEQVIHMAAIGEDGRFQIKVKLYGPQAFYFLFANQNLAIFAKPGDSLHLSFPAFAFMSEAGDTLAENFVNYSGDGHTMNTLIAKYRVGEFKLWQSFIEEKNKPENWECGRYKQLLDDRKAERQLLLQQFLLANKAAPDLFKRWAKADIEFDYINAILFPPDYKLNAILRCPNKWYGYAAPLDKLDVAMDSYCTYLNYLGTHFNQRFFATEPLHTLRKEQLDYASILIDSLLANTVGFTQELLLTYWFASSAQFPKMRTMFEPLLPRFFELVKDERCREHINQCYGLTPQPALPTDFLAKLESIKIADSIRNVLPQILEKHKGKVIVLDFWATWCGPCLGEMQRFYPVFIPKFKVEEVVFVFLAGKSPKSVWQRTVSELKFDAEHHLLTNDQDAVLKNLFSISGIPHHVLIDREGHVVDPKFEVNVDAIRRLINK